MKWFDRFHKLRESVTLGRLHTEQRQILTLLKGKVSKDDIPVVVVEPAGEGELEACIAFATEKHMRVSVGSGVKPLGIHGLGGGMLILTTRFSAAPRFETDQRAVRVEAGLTAEALAIDLSRRARRWHPLLPVPSGESLGDLIATGWEGLRNWKSGGVLSHVRMIEWMGYDGRRYSTGRGAARSQSVDMSDYLFGSRGRFGVITALELELQEQPPIRTAALFELRDAHDALKLLGRLRDFDPQPETVIYWGEVATSLIRSHNDGTISPQAGVVLMVEWDCEIDWPEEWDRFARPLTEEKRIAELWQDLFRLPRTVARLYPAKVESRLKLPAPAIVDMEAAARELGRDANVQIALWGTVEAGHLHVWALLPDEETRTRRQAEGAVRSLVEIAVDLDGSECTKSVDSAKPDSLLTLARERCDPASLFQLTAVD